MFVGYSCTQRGYRCFRPPTKMFLVSADVTFWESKPYFDSFTSLPTSTGHITSTPLPVEIVDTGDVQRQPLQGNTSRPLQVYHRRHKMAQPTQSEPPPPTADLPPQDFDIPIVLRKGTRYSTVYPISTFVSYDSLHPSFH